MQHSCLFPTVAYVNPMGMDIFQERTLFKEERLYTLEVQISIWSFRALHRNVNEHRCVDFHWPDL